MASTVRIGRCFVCLLLLVAAVPAVAAERKPLKEVSIDKMTSETQQVMSGDGSMNLVWVIPSEFWNVALTQEEALPEQQRQEIMKVLEKYMIIGIVRADISPLGAFRFYDEASVFDTLQITYVPIDGNPTPLKLQKRAEDEAQLIVDSMKPMLKAAMGNLGGNFHLFICDANVAGRSISSYDAGQVAVSMGKIGDDNEGGVAKIDFPLDSLFVPRACDKCGKEAHISWNFCPLCGQKHEK